MFNVSHEMEAILLSLLQFDPVKRWSFERLLSHRLFSKEYLGDQEFYFTFDFPSDSRHLRGINFDVIPKTLS